MERVQLGTDYRQQNPWWNSGDVSASDRYQTERRSDYQYKFGSVRSNRFTMIAGAAGSGKTTILHQIAHDLVTEDGVPPENIMYLPLGDPRFQIGSGVLRDAVDVFATYYWQRDSNSREGYVLVDDAHASQTWSKQVRWCVQQFDGLKVAVTLPTLDRAETSSIEEMGVEPERELLLPPKFYDVVTEHGQLQFAKENARDLRQALQRAVETGDTEDIQASIDKIESSVESPSVRRSVINYLQGAYRDTDTEDVGHNLESTIYRDIPRYQQFEDRSDLHALCAISALNPGRTLGLKDLSGVLECDRRTLQRYIDLLEDFFILTPSYQYQYERRRSVRLYLRDPLMVGALTEIDLTGLLDQETQQRLVPTVVFDHLKRLAFYYGEDNPPVHFWESGSEAVDFVIETKTGTPLPITAPDSISDRSQVDRIKAFCNEHDCKFGISIERDTAASVDGQVVTLPLWMFLLFI